MANYVSYLRVSTQRQGRAGLGIDAQRCAVNGFIQGVGGTLLAEFIEVESGARKARPILVQSIALCRARGAILLIAKLDRLARNVAFVSSLMESGVDFVAADVPFANRLMMHILAAFAEHERLQISERTKAALAAAKRRGVVLGKNGKHLAAQNREAAVAFASTLREPVSLLTSSGTPTYSEIAETLNSAGYRTRQGARWSPGTVHRLMGRLKEMATAAD